MQNNNRDSYTEDLKKALLYSGSIIIIMWHNITGKEQDG